MSRLITYDTAIDVPLAVDNFAHVRELTFMVDYRYVSPAAQPCHRLLELCGVLERFTALRNVNIVLHGMPSIRGQEVVLQTLLTVPTIRSCICMAVIDSARYTSAMRRLRNGEEIHSAYLDWEEDITMFPRDTTPCPCMIESLVWAVDDPSLMTRMGLNNLRQATLVFDKTWPRTSALIAAVYACEWLAIPYLAFVGRSAPSPQDLLSGGGLADTYRYRPSIILFHLRSQLIMNEQLVNVSLSMPHAKHICGIQFVQGHVVREALGFERRKHSYAPPHWDVFHHESNDDVIGKEFTERNVQRGKHRPFLAMFLTTLAIMRANANCKFLVDSALMAGINDVIYNFAFRQDGIYIDECHHKVPVYYFRRFETHAPWKEACKKLQRAVSTRFAVHVTSVAAPPPLAPRKMIVRGRKRKVVPQ